MTDATPQADEQEWPENCPRCGTRLQPTPVTFASDSTADVGATADVAEAVYADQCPNPDCPVEEVGGSGAPDATTPDQGTDRGGSLGDRQPDRPTLPGSLGGENGGA